MVQRIRNHEVTYATGKSLVDDPGPRPGDHAFESQDDPSYAEQVRRHRIESTSELVTLMREFGMLLGNWGLTASSTRVRDGRRQ